MSSDLTSNTISEAGSPAASFALLPPPPYYAVIFSSQRVGEDRGYNNMAEHMMALAARQPGFLGVESARSSDGFGMTVSYWESEAAIAAWKAHAEHQFAQRQGKDVWYGGYVLRIAKVERAYAKQPS